MYERQIMNVIEKSIIGKKSQEACEDGLVVTDDFIAVIDGSTSKTPKHLNPEMKNGRYAMMLISEYIRQELKADALADDFCQGITRYICDNVYKPLGVVERLLQHPEERLTASAVIYKQGKARGVDGGRWWCMDRSPKTLSQPCNLTGLHSLSVL